MTYSIIYATDLCAGTINLQSQLSVTTKSKTMDVSLELSNKGQTPSYDIIARITFFGKTKESKTISCLNPDATEKMLMIFDLQKNMKGDYPLIVEIQFHDINLYPFYSMRCTPIHIQSQTLDKRLTVQVPNIELSEQNKIDVHILNQNNLKKYVTVLMIVPGAFVCENNTHYKLLPKGQSVDIEYFLLKKDALPGSKHQGYVVITYIENAVNYAQITPFQISVKPVAQIWLFKKKNIAHIWFGVFLIWVLCMTYVMIIFKEFPKKK